VELCALRREFVGKGGPVLALDDVTLGIPAGQLVALLGENGAGKTTLVKIVSTLLLPTSGTVAVMGHDVVRQARAVRAATSVILGGDRGLYGMLSAAENLRYFGVLAGASRRDMRRLTPELLAQVGLADSGHRAVQTFSKGMKQRLHVAIGLVTSPPVMLLDEPTVGLDPNESQRLRETIAGLHERGTTILLTSHNLLDVQRLAQRVVMIAHGRVTHDLPLRDFVRLVGHEAVVVATLAGVVTTTSIRGATLTPGAGDRTVLTVPVPSWTPEVLATLAEATREHTVLDLTVRQTSLDEAFALASRGASVPGSS